MRKLLRQRGQGGSNITKGIADVEQAFLDFLVELGWPEEATPKKYTIDRLGESPSGVVLWQAWTWIETADWDGGFSVFTYLIDQGDGAEVFLTMSEERGEHVLSDLAQAAVSAEVVRDMGFDTAKWGTAILAALEKAVEPVVTVTVDGETVEDAAVMAAVKAALNPSPVEKAAGTYRVVKAEAEQRYTLGVAYPADEIDAHGDYTNAEELEKAAWLFMADVVAKGGGVGTDHAEGTDGAGVPVESYIYRGPDWVEDGDVVAKAGDWMLGAVWGDEAWERVQSGELSGWSIQGFAHRTEDE